MVYISSQATAQPIREVFAHSLDYETGRRGAYLTEANVNLTQHRTDVTETVLNEGIERFTGGKTAAKLLEVKWQNRINPLFLQRNKAQDSALSTQAWLAGAGVTIILLLLILAYFQYHYQKTRQKAIRLLKEKRDRLELLNHEKDQLFALVAHDIRNPMSAMKGMLYLLRNEELSESEMEEMLGQLEISMAQNLKMMENLLAWAQQQLSGLHVTLSNLNPKELIDEQLADHRFETEQKGIVMRGEVPDDLRVKADPNLLKLILRNLIGNAVKFTEEGGQIQVVARQKNKDIQIQVVDNGIGIPADQQQSIFSEDVHSRAGTKNEKGNGLGLNLCRDFVEAQDGHISFESEQNRGTTFTVTLPAAE